MVLSQDFLEKSILLLITASLSGFLIPYILKQIDDRKLKDQKINDARRLREQKEFDAQKLQNQKEFDENLIRENKVLEAQIELLENLSNSLWELQLLSLAVSYYKVHPNQKRFESALKNYDEKSWILFKDIRCEISKANRLTSKQKYQDLLTFFDKNLIRQVDEELMRLIENDASLEKWKGHYHWTLYTFPKEIDRIITPLAEELKLASPNSKL